MNNYSGLRKLIQKWKNEPPEPGENPEENWKQFLGEQVTYVYYIPQLNILLECETNNIQAFQYEYTHLYTAILLGEL